MAQPKTKMRYCYEKKADAYFLPPAFMSTYNR